MRNSKVNVTFSVQNNPSPTVFNGSSSHWAKIFIIFGKKMLKGRDAGFD